MKALVLSGVVALFLLTALYLHFQPQAADAVGEPASTIERPPAAEALQSTGPVEWVVRKGQALSGPSLVQVQQGSTVTMRITVDRADEVHVHGYDMKAELRPGTPSVLMLQADHAGRFEVELHHAHLTLGVLEVLPR